MLIQTYFDRTTTALRLVELCNRVRHRATNIIGKIQVQVIDIDIDRGRIVRSDALAKIRRDRDNSNNLHIFVEHLRLLWRSIGNPKHISAMKNLLHLLPLGSMIERYKRHRAASNCSGP